MTDSNLRALTDEELNSIDNQTDDLVEGNFDSNQVESDSSTIQRMSAEERKLHRDYDLDVKNHYRVEAGQNSPYGNISYRVLTNNGSGFAFCEDGVNRENLQCAVSGRSVEALGKAIERNRDAAQDEMIPAKLVKCHNGDFVIDCDNGDIILKADNIKLLAKGTSDTNDGDVHVQANKNVFIDAPDIRIVGSNLRLTARKDFTISAKVTGGIVAGMLNMASSDDFDAVKITKSVNSLLDALKAL